jgi:hypothetical protein
MATFRGPGLSQAIYYATNKFLLGAGMTAPGAGFTLRVITSPDDDSEAKSKSSSPPLTASSITD